MKLCVGKVNMQIDNNCPHRFRGSWACDPAERAIEHRRPVEPDPGNAGGGKLTTKKDSIRNAAETRIFAEMILFIALANALYLVSKFYLPFLHLPQGGTITIGSMVPIVWFSLRRGLRWGVEAGIIYGLVHMVISGDIYYPTQIILDYPLAFGALGLAGAFRNRPVIGVGMGILGRFACHFVSGVVFFGQYAWAGWNVYAYSAAYNATYLVPEFIISGAVIFLLLKRNLLNVYM
jgi:thiamine transporter